VIVSPPSGAVALAVGLRIGEALGLRWNDIDLNAKTLTVNNQLQRIDGVPKLVEPKSSRGRRVVALPTFAVSALQDHRKRQEEIDRGTAGERWIDTGFVFTSELGSPLDDSNVRRVLRGLLEKANLPHMRFHDLRHTCASLLLAQKVAPRVVMEILGHSQISLTMNTYSHVMPVLERDAADLMDNLLSAAN
jgi:integrase